MKLHGSLQGPVPPLSPPISPLQFLSPIPRTAKTHRWTLREISLFPGGNSSITKPSGSLARLLEGFANGVVSEGQAKVRGACAGCYLQVPKEQEPVFEGTRRNKREREKMTKGNKKASQKAKGAASPPWVASGHLHISTDHKQIKP
ncbi:hypothetical protein DL766_010434 [Monosporascus sp. MC13-8B]|uniref:Uncharacterized protein n=1 Tax=Monosporascus cannonballus TaxID=155416 RepID=A0ABY0HMC2_9PEZI|nr:hypothetical protein DL763_005675 [Monosporascus cannonballus]RYO93871.1 hypothetical protein DL762_000826 [Monosporascus cannonballus]RYP01788.1 hypothetical protein DL766_010434 [Monosporascus sp. MC13-8B]